MKSKKKDDKPKGSKVYVSSNIVDAIVKMKQHAEDLSTQRIDAKERLMYLSKRQVIDEGTILVQDSIENSQFSDEETISNEDQSPKST